MLHALFVRVCGSFLGGVLCGVACIAHNLCRMAMGDIEPACCLPSAVDVGRCPPPAAYLALGMPDTHTHSETRARTQPHRHRTAVLAIVSAQRSCS